MKRLLMVVLTIGGIGCAVDAGPRSSPAPADDSVDTNASMAEPGQVSPHFVFCSDGTCESRANCLAGGGIAGAPCNAIGGICCHLD